MAEPGRHPLVLLGMVGGRCFGRVAEARLGQAEVVLGAARHLAGLPRMAAERLVLPSSPVEGIELALGRREAGQRVCLLVSGDPGFFGLARVAAARAGPGALEIHPAPSSVSLAFARAGASWDDAVVVSAHGRSLEAAVVAVLAHPKVAVLVSPANPPESLGRALRQRGCGRREVVVCSHLGEPEETVCRTGLDGLAEGSFDPVSVVLLQVPDPPDQGMGLAWGLPERTFEHRAGMVTKAEVRAVALGKLALPPAGVLWDVGSGSGSVAVECSRLAPGLAVYAIERRPDDARRIRANSTGALVRVVEGQAPASLRDLPDPDRAFVGGGGIEVLEAVLARLRPGGVVVATYVALDRAAAASSRLGQVVQVAVSRGRPVGADGAMRLEAENPVFVCWGPGG